MSFKNIPIPPSEMRGLVGPTRDEDFDNPLGEPIYKRYGLPLDMYETVFDFGCGCGRLARQLLQQTPKPRRYVGIDPHRGMIDWCQRNLSPLHSDFRFVHHDVYSPTYAPENTLQLSEPFPVQDGEVTLFIAHSVFTHLCRQQTEYYLGELARVLKPQGVAFTSWFFFDRDSFPFLQEGPFCLYASEADFAHAVIYDRKWFINAVRRVGLGVRRTTSPGLAGHQWEVLLEKRTRNTVDLFPVGEEGAEWLCGATAKRIADPTWPPEIVERTKGPRADMANGIVNAQNAFERPPRPELFGALIELEVMRRGIVAGLAFRSRARMRAIWRRVFHKS